MGETPMPLKIPPNRSPLKSEPITVQSERTTIQRKRSTIQCERSTIQFERSMIQREPSMIQRGDSRRCIKIGDFPGTARLADNSTDSPQVNPSSADL